MKQIDRAFVTLAALVIGTLVAFSTPCGARAASGDSPQPAHSEEDLAKQLSNPVASLIAPRGRHRGIILLEGAQRLATTAATKENRNRKQGFP